VSIPRNSLVSALLLSQLLWSTQPCHAQDQNPAGTPTAQGAAAAIVNSVQDPDLVRLISEVLERNPQLAVLTAKARAAEQQAPQARSLPDPMASLTVFALQPQTRVGPQQAAVGISQHLPWFGKLKLKEQAALLEAAAAWSRVDARRLQLVTRVRELALELGYLEAEQRIVEEDKSTLEHYEELARARYASGVGIGQAVIKIQAEITKARTRLLGISQRRATLIAQINVLRDRPEGTVVALSSHTPQTIVLPALDDIRGAAHTGRPELGEAKLLIDAAAARVELAKRNYKPDLTVGLTYALVGKRDDGAGRLNPPEDNGNDIVGLTAGINLPIWRAKLKAGVEEALQRRLAAEEMRRATMAEIDGDLADLARRAPLIQEQVALFDKILTAQAEESLRSAETAYASGTVGALDLLDAERVLLGVRIAAARARTDLAVAAAKLEGVAAAPLTALERNGSAS